MLYNEAGQFSVRYAEDRRFFRLRQDRIGIAVLLAFAFAGVPLLGNDYWFNAILIPFLVLSLAGLRRLRFRVDVAGKPIPAQRRDAAETAARTALAALALAGVVRQRSAGYDLRSRSLLVAAEPLTFELLAQDGGSPSPFRIADADALLREAAAAAGKHGLGWDATPIRLQPTKKLAHLIVKSRELTAAGQEEAAG